MSEATPSPETRPSSAVLRPLGRWRLTSREKQIYRDAGLVRPTLQLDDSIVSEMRALLEETLSATQGQRPESLVCPHIAGMNGLPGAITDRWLDICTQPRIVDVVEEVLGPDIVLWGSQLFSKPAGTGLAVPWHQDGHFWPIRPLATCTVWVAIDDVDAENGGMMFVPGSHRTRELYPHAEQPSEESALNAELVPEHVDLARADVDALRAGTFSLHDVYLIHGSEPNRSSRRRAGFVIRYMPASSHYDRNKARAGSNLVDTKLAERSLFLLRGEDWTGKTGLIDLRHTQDA